MWLLILLACGQAPQQAELPPAVQRAMAQDLDGELGPGRLAFREHCQACHGLHADGDGPAAAALQDEGSSLAIQGRDQDALLRTIRGGVQGSAMQGYGHLDDELTLAMARWLASLPEPGE